MNRSALLNRARGPMLSPEECAIKVRALRQENKELREQHQANDLAIEAATADAQAQADALTVERERALDARVVRAELRLAAHQAGMIDLDALKLADLSMVTLNDAGELEGADVLMAELKEAKPYLFFNKGQICGRDS